MSKKWYKSKTLWTALLTILSGIGFAITGEQVSVDGELLGNIIAIIGFIFAALRITSTEKLS